jgi:hypothetical protein
MIEFQPVISQTMAVRHKLGANIGANKPKGANDCNTKRANSS